MRPGLLILCLALPRLILAHDFWIELSDFHPATGDVVRVHLRIGEHWQGEPVVRDGASIHCFVYGTNAVIGRDGRDPAGIFRAAEPGVIGYRSNPRPIELEPLRFEEYLWQEGLDPIIAERHRRGDARKPGREVYLRCAKALLGSRADVTQPLGFPLELVPTSAPQSGPFTVRLVYEQAPIAGVLVVAMSREEPHGLQRVRSDSQGRATFTLNCAGPWLIKAVHMIPARGPDPAADWESFWASLTFELR